MYRARLLPKKCVRPTRNAEQRFSGAIAPFAKLVPLEFVCTLFEVTRELKQRRLWGTYLDHAASLQSIVKQTAQLGSGLLCCAQVPNQRSKRTIGNGTTPSRIRDVEIDETKDVFPQVTAMHVTRHNKSSNFLTPVVLLPLERD